MSDEALNNRLRPYAGRWVALVGEQVAGVGDTPEAAKLAAQRSRPKERFMLRFVDEDDGEPLTLSPLLATLRPFFQNQSTPIYLVGGAVRDALLGIASHDLDFVLPEQAVKMSFKLANSLGVPAYVLDKERDTGRVMLPEQATSVDFARFRGRSLEEDLRDRDFTINAIALPATATTKSSIIDPCGGVADLKAKQIRLTNEAAVTRDPVRGLRAVRLAVQLGFSLTKETETAVLAAADQLTSVSAERLRDELGKILCTPAPDEGVQLLAQLNLLTAVLPELASPATVSHIVATLRWLIILENWCLGKQPENVIFQKLASQFGQHREHWLAHWNRLAGGELSGRLLLRLGGMLQEVHQINAGAVGRRLVLSKTAVSYLEALVTGRTRLMPLLDEPLPISRRTIYCYFRDTHGAGLDIMLLTLARYFAAFNGSGSSSMRTRIQSITESLLTHYFTHYEQTIAPKPLLDGNQLIKALSLKPGKEIGRLLAIIQEAQAAGDISTVEEAIELARQQ